MGLYLPPRVLHCEAFDLNQVINYFNDGDALKVIFANGKDTYLRFASASDRDAASTDLYNNLEKLNKKGKNMFQDIRKYISENRDLIYTVIFVTILDQLLFEGAFRTRLQKLVEGFLAKAESKHLPAAE